MLWTRQDARAGLAREGLEMHSRCALAKAAESLECSLGLFAWF